MIPTYNCLNYLKTTIEKVLLQAPNKSMMQIEVIDDCSTDGDIHALVQAAGNGRVEFYQQSSNVGSLRNFETCLNRAKGKLIHILHGDDYVEIGFYNEIEHLFARFPTIGAAFSDYTYIDEKGEMVRQSEKLLDTPGILDNWLITIAQKQRIQFPAMVVKRSVYEHLGGFYAVHYGEDWEMWTRIAAHYQVAYSPKNLAMYRVHSNNITSTSIKNGQHIHDINKVICLIQNYIPHHQKKRIKLISLKNYSIYCTQISYKLYNEQKNTLDAIKLSIAAIKLNLNSKTFIEFIKLLFKIVIGYRNK